jgi:hypothetical protein
MASYSYSLSFGADQSPDKITLGTSAPGAGNVELRVNAAATGASNEQVILILQAFIRRLEDGRLASKDSGLI